jgi:hypothetical protein
MSFNTRGCFMTLFEFLYESKIRPSTRDDKKYMVKVGDKTIHFGDPNMRIKKSNPERKKSFCARHNCATVSNKKTAKYWSCRMWKCRTGGK